MQNSAENLQGVKKRYFMKKAVKTLVSLLETNRGESSLRTEKYLSAVENKAPKAVLLSCPQAMRLLTVDRESLYTVESYGATVFGNEATLDYALRWQGVPLLGIMGHFGCSAPERAKKCNDATDAEKALYDEIAAGLKGAPKDAEKRIFHHIDHQVAVALERYGDLIKAGTLVVIGLYCDARGNLFLLNYNGLKGRDALAYSLPEVDASFFLA